MKEKINVLVIEPGEYPEVKQIKNELKAFQRIVDGHIEIAYKFGDDAVLLCNEEGKIMNLRKNKYLYLDGDWRETLRGTLVICGSSGEDFCSLTTEQIETYYDMFCTDYVHV